MVTVTILTLMLIMVSIMALRSSYFYNNSLNESIRKLAASPSMLPVRTRIIRAKDIL